MNQNVQALVDSIKHWENIRDGMESNYFAEACPLCKLHRPNLCDTCPINQESGNRCNSTPWMKYHRNNTPENAQEEIDFLKQVLLKEIEKNGDYKRAKEILFCCDTFKNFHRSKRVKRNATDTQWLFTQNEYGITYCPFCSSYLL